MPFMETTGGFVVRSTPMDAMPQYHPNVDLQVRSSGKCKVGEAEGGTCRLTVNIASRRGGGGGGGFVLHPAPGGVSGVSPGAPCPALALWEPLEPPALAALIGQKPNPLSEPP